MDRRGFIQSMRNKKSGVRITSGLSPYSGSWTVNEVTHLLRRTGFGARKADVDYFLTRSMSDAVDELLTVNAALQPPVRDYGPINDGGVLYDDVSVAIGQTWINDPNTASDPEARVLININRVESLRKWWAGLITNSGRSIEEKLVLFWHHHFAVQESEVGDARMLYRHHMLLRNAAMGDFRKLVKDVTVDAAMLLHLNGFLNTKKAPDENYARELQELFTIGKDTPVGFAEQDVIEAARVLTGWRVNYQTATSFFETASHDTGSKTFSAFYNNTSIAGNADGLQELDALVNMIFNSSEASKFIIRKLYRWFVYYDITDAVEANVIVPLATIFRNQNFQIKPVLEALFKSEHFFDVQNQACYIKSPYDIIVGALHDFDVPVPAYTDYASGYPFFYNLYERSWRMQMRLLQPPDVAGWPSYYQDPMHYQLWVNSNSLPRRADYTNGLVDDNILDLRAFAAQTSAPANPNILVDEASRQLLRYPLSATSKTWVKNKFLLNGGTDDNVWTAAWNTNNTAAVTPALKNMFKFLMNLPEYHLC